MILVGFVMTMILGVALGCSRGLPRKTPAIGRRSPWPRTGCSRSEPPPRRRRVVAPAGRGDPVRVGIVSAARAQIAALVLFFYTMWPRIRGVGSQIRERAEPITPVRATPFLGQ